MELNKDTFKKFIKYVLMILIVSFASLSIPQNMMSHKDASLIGLVVASTFVILDLVMPSICLK